MPDHYNNRTTMDALGLDFLNPPQPINFGEGANFWNDAPTGLVPYSLDFLQGAAGQNATKPGGFGDLDITGKLGVINSGLGAFSTLANMYAGFKALGLQKDQFNFQKEFANKNYEASRTAFNNEVTDRGIARQASSAARGGQGFDAAALESFKAERQIQA